MLKLDLHIHEIYLKLGNLVLELGLIWSEVDPLMGLLCLLLLDLSIDILLVLLVLLNQNDGVSLSLSLSFCHLALAEDLQVLLLGVLDLDVGLELLDVLIELRLKVLNHIAELEERTNFGIIFEGATAVVKQVKSGLNVRLSQLLGLLILILILVLVGVHAVLSLVQLRSVVIHGGFSLLIFYEFIIQVLQVWQKGDNPALVVLVTRVFEQVSLDFEHL